MSITLLISSDPETTSSDSVRASIQAFIEKQELSQIFFIGSGLKHSGCHQICALLARLKTEYQTKIGYCPSSAARHIPDFSSNIIEDYGLTQFYAFLHQSSQLEQL